MTIILWGDINGFVRMEFKVLDLDFPTESVEEGEVSVLVPKIERIGKCTPPKTPVFYNPIMELNRDIAILALQTYQKMVNREIFVCEPFTGCGIRGIRFAVEVKGVRKVLINDLNPHAVKLAYFNVKSKGLTNLVTVENKDANLLLSQHAAPRKRFDFIDIDPFGSPAPYLDSAVRALRGGGMLALTATDLAPLCGVHPKACTRKYGGKPLRTEYCHEVAVRLLAGCLAMTAARHGIGTNIVFSQSVEHYIRIYATLSYGAKKADESVRKMGYILHCFNCFYREISRGFLPVSRKCPECGSKLDFAGPLWLGKIFNKDICLLMRKEAEERSFKNKKRIVKLLSLACEEAEAPITYYVLDKLCDKMNVPIPPLTRVLEELKNKGFKATRTHFHGTGFRTDATVKIIMDSIKKLTE